MYSYHFPTHYQEIISRLKGINPQAYASNRNYLDGDVSLLSPYISRGVISTKQVYIHLLSQGYETKKIEKFVQELAWRDYWQQIWIEKGGLINSDLKQKQNDVHSFEMSSAIINAQTGIEAIDKAIRAFYETGYIHNHIRMYIASLCCNIAGNHWKVPAQWMYYHLLDADWASNALSWQWVGGSNSHKKYYANQENINKYCHTEDTNTFLDVDYPTLVDMDVPEALASSLTPDLAIDLPASTVQYINPELPTLIYNFYNMDPLWHQDIEANRILLLEPEIFNAYPISQNTLNFLLKLCENIKDIQIYTRSFDQLVEIYKLENIRYKEHPLNAHYRGTEEPRDWMFPVKGYFPSFFKYWKVCSEHIT